eukprot:g3016.t1
MRKPQSHIEALTRFHNKLEEAKALKGCECFKGYESANPFMFFKTFCCATPECLAIGTEEPLTFSNCSENGLVYLEFESYAELTAFKNQQKELNQRHFTEDVIETLHHIPFEKADKFHPSRIFDYEIPASVAKTTLFTKVPLERVDGSDSALPHYCKDGTVLGTVESVRETLNEGDPILRHESFSGWRLIQKAKKKDIANGFSPDGMMSIPREFIDEDFTLIDVNLMTQDLGSYLHDITSEDERNTYIFNNFAVMTIIQASQFALEKEKNEKDSFQFFNPDSEDMRGGLLSFAIEKEKKDDSYVLNPTKYRYARIAGYQRVVTAGFPPEVPVIWYDLKGTGLSRIFVGHSGEAFKSAKQTWNGQNHADGLLSYDEAVQEYMVEKLLHKIFEMETFKTFFHERCEYWWEIIQSRNTSDRDLISHIEAESNRLNELWTSIDEDAHAALAAYDFQSTHEPFLNEKSHCPVNITTTEILAVIKLKMNKTANSPLLNNMTKSAILIRRGNTRYFTPKSNKQRDQVNQSHFALAIFESLLAYGISPFSFGGGPKQIRGPCVFPNIQFNARRDEVLDLNHFTILLGKLPPRQSFDKVLYDENLWGRGDRHTKGSWIDAVPWENAFQERANLGHQDLKSILKMWHEELASTIQYEVPRHPGSAKPKFFAAIDQYRNKYRLCMDRNTTGDFLRLWTERPLTFPETLPTASANHFVA